LTEEEEIAATQKTPDAPSKHHLSQIQQSQQAHQYFLDSIRGSSLESVASSDSEEESDDNEPEVLLTRQTEPFVPHPHLVAQVKFENTETPMSQYYRQINASTNNNKKSAPTSTTGPPRNKPTLGSGRLEVRSVTTPNSSPIASIPLSFEELTGDDQLALMTQAILEETEQTMTQSTTTSTAPDESVQDKLHRLAGALSVTGVDLCRNLQENQKAIVRNCKRGSTSKHNIQQKERMVHRMEDTIRNHGSQLMVELLLGDGKVPVKYNDMSKAIDKLDYPMYNLLAGEKTATKKQIINSLLTLASLTG
jgi:hypothetical protein